MFYYCLNTFDAVSVSVLFAKEKEKKKEKKVHIPLSNYHPIDNASQTFNWDNVSPSPQTTKTLSMYLPMPKMKYDLKFFSIKQKYPYNFFFLKKIVLKKKKNC
jgi:hypothetical protein